MDNELKFHEAPKEHPGGQSLYEAFLSTHSARVMLLIADPIPREPLALALRQEGYDVTEVVWRAELFDYLGEPLYSCSPVDLPDLIVADLDTIGDRDGVEILNTLRKAASNTHLVLLTPGTDLGAAEQQRIFALNPSRVFEREAATDDLRDAILDLVHPR